MREIELTQGFVAIVDDDDFALVSGHRWHAHRGNRTWYARTNLPRGQGKQTSLRMHQLIMGRDSLGRQVDHINLNGLDNRRSNLRFATYSEQRQNTALRSDNASGFRGVYKAQGCARWIGRVSADGTSYYLGMFRSPEGAARAYDAKVLELFGELALLNFPAQEIATK